jgi:DNA-binding MarR family transcriptional regulator
MVLLGGEAVGIFDRMKKEIDAREEQEGITLADLLDLSPPLRRLMNRITREGQLSVERAAELLEETPANAQQTLNAFVDKGYLEREKQEGEWVYRTRFARTRPRQLPAGVWSALGGRPGSD